MLAHVKSPLRFICMLSNVSYVLSKGHFFLWYKILQLIFHFISQFTMMLIGHHVNNRCSIHAYCVFLGINLIFWHTSKQKVVTRSNTKSRYRTMATTIESSWLPSLFSKLKRLLFLFIYNLRAQSLAHNPILKSHTNQVELYQCFVKDEVLQNQLII